MLPSLNYRARKADVDALVEYPRPTIHLDTYLGNDGWLGTDWNHPVQTMARALALVETGGRVLFKGKVTEEITGSNLKFDITIEGVGSLHHADQPGSGSSLYDYGSSVWQPPASPTATTPLLKIRGRGWKIKNILFDCPVDSAAIYLERNALSGTSEYDASHASIVGCDFRNGKYAIQDVGGCWNVLVKDCVFETIDEASGCAIINTSTSVAAPRRWQIVNNFFQPDSTTEGNLQHVDSPLAGSLIRGNVFGKVKSTAIYVDLTGGQDNTVFENQLSGDYTTADYVAGTNDVWFGNWCAVTATTAPDGHSLVVPAAPQIIKGEGNTSPLESVMDG